MGRSENRIRTVAGTALLAVTSVATVGLAVEAVVREDRPAGILLFVAGGSVVAALVAGRGRPWRLLPPYGMPALLVVAALTGPPVALAARLSPGRASGGLSRLPAMASVTAEGEASVGYVLHGSGQGFTDDAELVRVRPGRLGSWTADRVIVLPDACRLSDRVDGVEGGPQSDPGGRSAGVLIARTDFDRVCHVETEHVVVGFAPPGTSQIEVVTIAGEEVDVPIGASGSYLVMLEEDTIASTFVRLSFRDARGLLLDSKAVTGSDDYANFAYASRLIERGIAPESPVTVSRYILPPREYKQLCGEKAPYGDGFVGIAIVRRDDGEHREVVIGNGMPFSAGHPRPAPPRVRESGLLPCFLT